MIDHSQSRSLSLVPTQEELTGFNEAVSYWLSRGYTEMSACMLALARWAPLGTGMRRHALSYIHVNTNQRVDDLV